MREKILFIVSILGLCAQAQAQQIVIYPYASPHPTSASYNEHRENAMRGIMAGGIPIGSGPTGFAPLSEGELASPGIISATPGWHSWMGLEGPIPPQSTEFGTLLRAGVAVYALPGQQISLSTMSFQSSSSDTIGGTNSLRSFLSFSGSSYNQYRRLKHYGNDRRKGTADDFEISSGPGTQQGDEIHFVGVAVAFPAANSQKLREIPLYVRQNPGFSVTLGYAVGSVSASKTIRFSPPAPPPPPPQQPTASLSVTPTSIFEGETARMSWSFTGGTAFIHPDIGAVSGPTGARTIAPLRTTTYTITVTGASGTIPAVSQATLAVTPLPPPPPVPPPYTILNVEAAITPTGDVETGRTLTLTGAVTYGPGPFPETITGSYEESRNGGPWTFFADAGAVAFFASEARAVRTHTFSAGPADFVSKKYRLTARTTSFGTERSSRETPAIRVVSPPTPPPTFQFVVNVSLSPSETVFPGTVMQISGTGWPLGSGHAGVVTGTYLRSKDNGPWEPFGTAGGEAGFSAGEVRAFRPHTWSAGPAEPNSVYALKLRLTASNGQQFESPVLTVRVIPTPPPPPPQPVHPVVIRATAILSPTANPVKDTAMMLIGKIEHIGGSAYTGVLTVAYEQRVNNGVWEIRGSGYTLENLALGETKFAPSQTWKAGSHDEIDWGLRFVVYTRDAVFTSEPVTVRVVPSVGPILLSITWGNSVTIGLVAPPGVYDLEESADLRTWIRSETIRVDERQGKVERNFPLAGRMGFWRVKTPQ